MELPHPLAGAEIVLTRREDMPTMILGLVRRYHEEPPTNLRMTWGRAVSTFACSVYERLFAGKVVAGKFFPVEQFPSKYEFSW